MENKSRSNDEDNNDGKDLQPQSVTTQYNNIGSAERVYLFI